MTPARPPHPLDALEKAMDEFLTDALDPEYIIRERLHIEIEQAKVTHTSAPAPERKVICTDSSVSDSNPCNDNCMRCTEARVIPAEEIPGLPECNGCETGVCCEACHVWMKAHDAQVAKAERERLRGICTWKEDDEWNWHTSCDQIHQFTNGTPEENHYGFCPHCGGNLRLQQESHQ